MASSITKPGKQLGELLQKEQDPFVLDIFLNERRYVKRNASDSNKSRKRRNAIPSCSKILRAILGKFGFNKSDQSQNTRSTDTTTTTTTDDDQIQGKSNEKMKNVIVQQVSEPDRLSSASSKTVYNSCSDSEYSQDESSTSLDQHEHDSFEATRLSYKTGKEAISGGAFVFRQLIGNNNRSSVSVVQEESSLSQEKINLIRRQSLETKTKISSLIMAREVREKPRNVSTKISDPRELHNLKSKPSRQFLKSKRVLSKTRQLLFECVREIVETHAKKEKVHYGKGVLGPEELGELLWEKMKAWSKQSTGDDTNNITYLLCLDFVDTAQEWNGFDSEKKEIFWEIGDAIAEEIMNEFVIETMC
ncbi:uncharacterized protein LOC133803184 isoform X2 [Humulus lupulus]|uniref:uncharacterized protein LOC133803184 isoform X2 n=1 Tax=Humulus lupulus TaxID=3486 RepID=UPI002B407E40|nr:uncharacterized protein LOC133803184 isoform X2 [Humulus lupulus]